MTYKNIVILTGAGLSAESGLGTFRDDDGLWSQYDLADVATPEGFQRDPQQVWEFYNLRRANGIDAQPNEGHLALAKLEKEFSGQVTVVTQNIDHLHELAGSQNLIHMHGSMLKMLCAHCGKRTSWENELGPSLSCPSCNETGGMRPDVVWFGEMPYAMNDIEKHLKNCDLFLSIGTSGTVYPAAGFVALANASGARTVELNLEPSEGASQFHEARTGPASQVVPAYVDELQVSK